MSVKHNSGASLVPSFFLSFFYPINKQFQKKKNHLNGDFVFHGTSEICRDASFGAATHHAHVERVRIAGALK